MATPEPDMKGVQKMLEENFPALSNGGYLLITMKATNDADEPFMMGTMSNIKPKLNRVAAAHATFQALKQAFDQLPDDEKTT